MKHFLLNPRVWRKIGFIMFVILAALILFGGLKCFVTEVLNHERTYASVYEALKTSLLYNLIGGLLLGIGILLYEDSIAEKISLCAAIGICGMGSFLGYGFFVLFYGFAAGKFLASLGLFVLTVYASFALMVGIRSYNCYLWDKIAKEEKKSKETAAEQETTCIETAI